MKRTHSSTLQRTQALNLALPSLTPVFWRGCKAKPTPHKTTCARNCTQLLSNALAHNGLELNLRRIYWYSDALDDQAIGGQVSRAVLPHSQDGGLSMLRTLGADLKRLAERGACDHLLVGSDDERLDQPD